MSTRQLRDILASGEIEALKLMLVDVKPELEALIDARVSELMHGHVIAETTAAEANLNAFFFNTDNQQLCWKSSGGLVFRLRMQLV